MQQPSPARRTGSLRRRLLGLLVFGCAGVVVLAASSWAWTAHAGDPEPIPPAAAPTTTTSTLPPHGDHLSMDDIPPPTRPLTRAERRERDGQLAAAIAGLPGPTVDDAVRAGWTTYGVQNHISHPGVPTDHFDPARPPLLLTYEGKQIVALVYWVDADAGDPPPEGFAGPEDQWHHHGPACRIDGKLVLRDEYPVDECRADGGEVATPGGYMLHVWAIPGHENPRGLFAPSN